MATPAEIIADANCSACLGISLFESMEITILKQILTELGVTMTQAEINAESGCFTCYGLSLGQANVLVLLNAIAGGMSGAGAIAPGSGSPEGVVTASPGQTYWDFTNQQLWVKEAGSGTTGWVPY